MRRRQLLLGSLGGAAAPLVVGRDAFPHLPTTTPDTLAARVVVDAADGDVVLPLLAGSSVALERVELRAHAGPVAVDVAPALVTGGTVRRRVAVADHRGALATTVRADAPPVVLRPTRDHVVGGERDLRGTRLLLFGLSRTRGAGRLEIRLEATPVPPLVPSFARTGPAAALGEGHRVHAFADPLGGADRLLRSATTTARGGGVTLAVDGGRWIFVAFRLWDPGADRGSLPLLRALDAGRRDVFGLRVHTTSPPRLELVTAADGPRGQILLDDPAGWTDCDPEAVPATTGFVPLLVHLVADGGWRLWVQRLSGPPAAAAGGPARGAVRTLTVGALAPSGARPRIVDLLGPRVWGSDPRRAAEPAGVSGPA